MMDERSERVRAEADCPKCGAVAPGPCLHTGGILIGQVWENGIHVARRVEARK